MFDFIWKKAVKFKEKEILDMIDELITRMNTEDETLFVLELEELKKKILW